MTIAHVVETFSGGVHTFLMEITRHLSGHDHIVIHGLVAGKSQSEHRKDFPPNVTLVPWPHANRDNGPLKDLKALASLYKLLRSQKFDVLHLHSSKAGFLGRLAAKANGDGSVVYTTHAAPFLRQDIRPLAKKFYVGLERFSENLVGRVVCCSLSEAEEVRKQGIKCTYINNGTFLGEEPKAKTFSQPLTVINCGRITEQKDPASFNEIAKHFASQTDLIVFKWVGDGNLRRTLTSPNISVTGWLDRKAAAGQISKGDIFLSTSQWEGLSLAILEAMAQGKALVLSRCTGNIDMVREGINGHLFDNNRTAITVLEKMIEDTAKVDRMGMQSRQICSRQFDIRDTFEAYESLYLSMAAN